MAENDNNSSDHDFNNNEPVFYYNREERIKNAPKAVQDYYNGTAPKPAKGLFKVLVATKANRIIFFVLVFVVVLFVGFYFFGSKTYKGSLDGINYELSAFSYEDVVYVTLKMDKDSEDEISVKITSFDSENQILDKCDFSKSDCDELKFRTKFENYDTIKVAALVRNETNQKELNLSCKVEEK